MHLENFHLCIYACPSLTCNAGAPLRLMSDKQKYKLKDCNPDAGGCRCVTEVRSTQPGSLKIFRYNQMPPKTIRAKVCCHTLLKALLFVPVVFRAALNCPGVVVDSPKFRPCRGFQTNSKPAFRGRGFGQGERHREITMPCISPCSPVLADLFPFFWLTDPAATGFGWGWRSPDLP